MAINTSMMTMMFLLFELIVSMKTDSNFSLWYIFSYVVSYLVDNVIFNKNQRAAIGTFWLTDI